MRARQFAVGLAVFVLGLAAAAQAQEMSISVAAGGLFPSGDSYREIYGPSVVWTGDVWLKLKGRFGFATGFGQLTDDGTASGPSDLYPVRFRRRTIPIVLFYQFDIGPVDIRAGAGVGFHSFKETWRTVDLEYSGSKTAPRCLLSVSVEVVKRLSLFSSVTYDPIREGFDTSYYSSEIKLGGAQVVGGLAFRII